jgi:hypothetical protein
MTKKRNKSEGFVRAGDLLPGFEGIAPILQEIEQSKALTPQGRHHYNRLKQIDALASVGETQNPDMGFMTRLLTLCSLPRTDPGTRLQYLRQNGPYTLAMIAGANNKLPFGNIPRLLLAWVCTEAVQTQSRELTLGPSLLSFMRQLGMTSNSGGSRGDRTRLKNQMDRLFSAHVQFVYETAGHKKMASSAVADRMELWWDYKQPEQDTLWMSRIRLGEDFFNEIIEHPIPLDMDILKKLRRSSLGLDLYMWLSYKTYRLYSLKQKPENLGWERLYVQFAADPSKVNDKYAVDSFRKDVVRELKKLKLSWRSLDYATPKGSLEIRPCQPSIAPKAPVSLCKSL